MPKLTWGRLRIFASGAHVDDRPAIHIKTRQNTVHRNVTLKKMPRKMKTEKHRSSNCARTSARQRRAVWVGKGSAGSHLPRRSLDLDLIWWDELRLELAAPLDGALDTLAPIFEFPLGCAHVACDGVWPIKPAALPWCIGIIIGEAKRVRILKSKQKGA
jgi:hypothetical protein